MSRDEELSRPMSATADLFREPSGESADDLPKAQGSAAFEGPRRAFPGWVRRLLVNVGPHVDNIMLSIDLQTEGSGRRRRSIRADLDRLLREESEQ